MTDLTTAAERWREATAEEKLTRGILIDAVRAAYKAGGVSEYALAVEIGVDRGTIRRWLLKG